MMKAGITVALATMSVISGADAGDGLPAVSASTSHVDFACLPVFNLLVCVFIKECTGAIIDCVGK